MTGGPGRLETRKKFESIFKTDCLEGVRDNSLLLGGLEQAEKRKGTGVVKKN